MGLHDAFHHHFASHLIGLAKPDAAAFQHVIKALDVSPEEILFLDDNLLNVTSAQKQGMKAERVQGLKEVKRCLKDCGIFKD